MRDIEQFTVAEVQNHDDTIILISTGGCIFHRPAGDFSRLPQAGEELVLESIGCRVSGLYAPKDDVWFFRWSDEDLAEQDAAAVITTE